MDNAEKLDAELASIDADRASGKLTKRQARDAKAKARKQALGMAENAVIIGDAGSVEPTAETDDSDDERTPVSRGHLSPANADGTNRSKATVTNIPVILSPAQAKAERAVHDVVYKAITVAATSQKGTTAAIFSVLRACDTATDADNVFRHIEQEWLDANVKEYSALPDSWKSLKSRYFKPFKELPQTVEAGVKAAAKLSLAQSDDESGKAARLESLRLDGGTPMERMHPRAFQTDQASVWLQSVALLSRAIKQAQTAEERAARKQSGGTGSGVQSGLGSLDKMPEEIRTAASKLLQAIRLATGKVQQQEIVNMLNAVTEDLAERTAKFQRNAQALALAQANAEPAPAQAIAG